MAGLVFCVELEDGSQKVLPIAMTKTNQLFRTLVFDYLLDKMAGGDPRGNFADRVGKYAHTHGNTHSYDYLCNTYSPCNG